MSTNVSAAPKLLGDGNTQGVLVNSAKDSAGNAAKLGFFGTTPVAQPALTGDTHTPTAGSTTAVYVNTTFDGSTGSTAFTIGDIVATLKAHGLLKA